MKLRRRPLLLQSDGVATIEFAMILPILLIMMFGTFEAAEVLRASMKVAVAAESIADMVAQETRGVSDGPGGSLGNFCKAAQDAMTPLLISSTAGDAGAFSASIVSVTNHDGTASVDWESDQACAARADAFGLSAVALASAPITSGMKLSCAVENAANLLPCVGDSIIVVRVSYEYRLPLGINLGRILLDLPGSFASATLAYVAYAVPRGYDTIPCVDAETHDVCSS